MPRKTKPKFNPFKEIDPANRDFHNQQIANLLISIGRGPLMSIRSLPAPQATAALFDLVKTFYLKGAIDQSNWTKAVESQ